MALKVKWPIVATCTVEGDRYPYNYSHSFEGNEFDLVSAVFKNICPLLIQIWIFLLQL